MEGQEQLDEKVIEYIGEKELDDYMKGQKQLILIQQLYNDENNNEKYLEADRKYRNEHKIYRKGDKIKLVKMEDGWMSLKPGAEGYITGFGVGPKHLQIWVNWEIKSDLCVVIPVDEIEIVECGQ